jgi:hypothetical protein
MYLVEKVELLVYNRMTGRHEKGHRQVEGLHSTHNAYNICNSLVIKLYTNTTLEGFGSAALSSRNDGNHPLPISIYLPPVPEIIDPVFAKTSQNARFLLSEYERFGLVFTKTRVYKFRHR